ncbi:hypothetical protein HanRHA438_Chr08g0343541 [Helianthus annuus]|nr:hypothetical protein HanHA300_Chr08g0274311 [Helianthus annuus]KAJ0546259.1 hypothetical protein HanIR_Chr08g0358871 [Helianthus annuus]KAJ0553015.1 hypothetical protein HanHA89_Chr08g0291641 [Helianthus annuus]KAJ0721936.1 hypothetical protein HanOQP8_Chr08g0281001 [Helianthus annuus]KAJ0897247.1 hypothetical protein HanRHA438_Chr08g0343541 [Helianthus annuus]
MATPKMTLKLLVDKKVQRVLFAETNKEFVDFLFHIFSLPLGTLIEFVGSKKMVGCLGKLKESIETFQGTYLQPGIKKDDIFNPKTPYSGNTFLLSYKVPSVDESGASKAIYRCSNASIICSCYNRYATCRSNASVYANATCPSCCGSMKVKMASIMPKEDATKEMEEQSLNKMKGGYVKEFVTYMVMDDLVVKPMSTISSLTLISKFGVKDLSQLEEKMVSFGKDEVYILITMKIVYLFIVTSPLDLHLVASPFNASIRSCMCCILECVNRV